MVAPRFAPEHLRLLVVLALAAGLRVLMSTRTALSYDEVFGALFSVQSFADMLLAVLRFDIHPPLWNVQLWLWARLGDSAAWLRASSTLWSLVMIGLTWSFARPRLGEARALAAATALALLPQAVITGAEVRMYPMLGALVVLAWIMLHRLFEAERARWTDAGLLAVQLALAYTHGSGSLQVFLLGVYGLVLIRTSRPSADRVRAWVKVEVLTGLLALPAAANALVRNVAHTKSVSVEQVLTDLAKLFFGRDWPDPTWMVVVGSALFFSALAAALKSRALRPLAGTYLAFGLLAIAAISFALRPVWYFRTLLPFLPIYALALSELAVGLAERLRRPLALAPAGALAIALVGVSARSLVVHTSPCDIAGPVAYARARLEPGDLVYAPLVFDAWSVAWHWTGGPWGSPLEVGNTDLPLTGKWRKLLGALTPSARSALRLAPRTHRIELGESALFVGPGAKAELTRLSPPRVHLVDSGTVPALSGELSLPGYEVTERRRFADGVLYVLLERSTSTSTSGAPVPSRGGASLPP